MAIRAEVIPTGRRRRLFKIICMVSFACVAEVVSCGAGRVLQRKWLMYGEPITPPRRIVQSYKEYLAIRDDNLGWPCAVEFVGNAYDSTGARPCPAYEDPEQHSSCVSLYGDSFVRGDEVDHEHAWGNLLARRLRCRVANLGVGGYGSDQAYLRFKSHQNDESSVVILGHVSENILRNLTRNRDLLTYRSWYALKPRFVLDVEGDLELVPLPRLSKQEYNRMVGRELPQLVLEHESFHPGGPAGAIKLDFPYSYSMVRNLGDFRVRAKFARRPLHAEFYRKDHPLHGLEITRAILEAFCRDARLRGKHPLVILFPTKGDLVYYKRTGKWTYGDLAEELKRSDVDFLDFGPRLLEYVGARSLDELFKPRTHYNEEVNRLIAEVVAARIADIGELEGIAAGVSKGNDGR